MQAAKANNVIDVSLRRSHFSFLNWLALFPRRRSLQASLVSYMSAACYLDYINASVTMSLCKRSLCCSLDPCSGSVCDFKVNHLHSWHAICVETAPESVKRIRWSHADLHNHAPEARFNLFIGIFQMLWLWCHVLNSKHLFHVLLLVLAGQMCTIFNDLHWDFCLEAASLSLFRLWVFSWSSSCEGPHPKI